MILNNQDYQNLSNEMLKREEKYFMFLGLLYVIGGIFSLFTPLVSGSIFVMILGAFLMVLGIESFISTFRSKKDFWTRIFKILIGVLYLVVGYNFFTNPLVEGAFLGIFGACLFIIVGIKKIILSFKSTATVEHQNCLLVVSGVLNLILAGIVLKNPFVSLLLIGIFIGLELLAFGVIFVITSNHMQKILKTK